jgi:hypothetical protein
MAEEADLRYGRLEEALARLAEAQARTDARLERLEAAVERLAEAQARTEERVQSLADALATLTRAVDDLRGQFLGAELERRYQQNAPAYFSPLARGLRTVDKSGLADLLDDAGISDEERRDVLAADLVLTGRRRQDGQSLYLVVEVSVGVGQHDVERADRRARVLRQAMEKLRHEPVPVIAIVAGQSIDAGGRALAQERGVWQVSDGWVSPPRED